MTISSTSPLATPTPVGAISTPSAGAASRDQFLRLFVAQLENQNPLDPQSGADMVAQLAQFSSVEQAVETNRHLADLIAAQDAAGSAGLSQLVGRDVTANASTITLEGAPPPIQIATTGDLAGGEAVIKDADGKVVRTVAFGPGASPQPLAWDGKDANGAALPPGTYTIEVSAHDAAGVAIDATPQVHAVVDALELTAAGPLLHLGGARISPAAVTTIARTGV